VSDIKKRLQDALPVLDRHTTIYEFELVKDALAEIERLEGLNDQCVDLVRVSCPGIRLWRKD
jgi:hypothetical protein